MTKLITKRQVVSTLTTIILILTITLTIAPIVASAATITVGSTGADYTTIQAAINASTAGDTIYVYNGTYTENVIVDEQVTLQGEGADVVNVTNSTANSHVFWVTVDYVNISGFNVTGATGVGKAGFHLNGRQYCNISDNNASGNYYGIYLLSSSNNTLTSNNASNNSQHGIYLYFSSNNTLTSNNVSNNNYGFYLKDSSNNTLTSNSQHGIYLLSSSNYNTLTSNNANSNTDCGIHMFTLSNNNTLTSNNALNNSQHGIYLWASSNNTLTSNNVSNNNYGFYLKDASNNNTLKSNNANSNTNCGIYLLSSSNNTLMSNNANSNTNCGIFLLSSSNNTLTSNNASNNNQHGIYLWTSSNNTLTSNNANSNINYGFYLKSLSNNNTLTSNNASNNTNCGICLLSSSNNTIYNNYFNNTKNADDDGVNIWNTTRNTGTNIIGESWLGGNYWSDYAGSDTVDSDGLGDTLTPYNSSGDIENGGDYHPLIDTTPPDTPTIYVPTDGELLTSSYTWVNGTKSADTTNVTVYVNSSITNASVAVSGTTYNISNVPLGADGDYEINVSAKDAAGNVNTTNATVTVTVDTTPPNTPTIAVPANGETLTSSTTWVNGTTDVDTTNVTVYVNGSATNTSVAVSGTFNISNVPLGADGDHEINVSANDAAGNVNTTNATVTVTVDTTAPNIPTIDVPANSAILTSADTWVNGTISADTTNVTVYVNGSATNTSVAASGTFNISSVPLGADGDYEINVSAMDAFGNVNTTNATVTVTVDTTSPTLTIDLPQEGYNYNTSTVSLNVTADETIDTWLYNINGTANVTFTPNTTLPSLPDGIHNVTLYANDSAGNIGSALVNFTVDTTAPTIIIANPTAASKAYKKGGQQMYVNFTYVEANPKNYTIQIRNATDIINSTAATPTTSSPVNVSFTMNVTAADGDYNVTVTMWDNASNTNTATEVDAVSMDTTPPTAPTNLVHTDDAPGGYDNDNSTDISWSAATDASSTVIYRIYRDGVLNYSTELLEYTFTGETEGTHEYNVGANDSVGNINTTNASVTVIIDYTDPVIHNVSLSDTSPAYGQVILVSVNVTDKNLGSVTAGSTSLTHQSGALWNGTITAGYGVNTVTVTAYDNASNSATNSSLSYTGPAAPTSSSSSGSVGVGVGSSNEPENVEETVVLRIFLGGGSSSTYNFNNVVTSVEVTPDRTYGLVAARIEVLAGQPGSITSDLPAGVLYKYVNIFVGTSGWAEGKLSDSMINFQVPTSWFEENNIDPASVVMYRHHNGEWELLESTTKGQAGGFYQYSSPTLGFSTFLILGQVEGYVAGETVATADSGTVADSTPASEATATKGTPGFGILVGILAVISVLVYRKRN